jgi:hypothetical protein
VRDWRKPALWGVVALVVFVAVLDRDLDRVVYSLPIAALGGGLCAFVLAGVAFSAGSRWSKSVALLVGGITVVYAAVAWYALRHQDLIHTGVGPWLLGGLGVGAGLVAFNRMGAIAVIVDVALGVVTLAWIVLIATGSGIGLQRDVSGLVVGAHALVASIIVAIVGIALLLVTRWVPTRGRAKRPDGRFLDRSFMLTSLLRYPGLTLGATSVLRADRRTWLRIALGAVTIIPLGIGLSEGLLFLGPLVAALGSWLGWELTSIITPLVSTEGILGVLPRTRGSYGRRVSVVPVLAAFVLLGVAILIAWRVSFLAGFATAAVIALGCGVGFVGAGVALRVIVSDRSLAMSRWITSVLVVGLAGCALAPLVQLNNAFGAHGLFFEYTITGTSFSIVVGVVGISLMSWWRGEIRDS